MVDAFLEARDVLLRQLDAHREGGEAPVEAASLIRTRLQALAAADDVVAPAKTQTVFDVKVFVDSAASADEIRDSLATLGEAVIVEPPAHGEAEPRVPWQVSLTADCDEAMIIQSLSLIASPDAVSITRRNDAPAAHVEATLATTTQTSNAYGVFDQVKAAPASTAPYGFFEGEGLPVDASAAHAVSVLPVHGCRAAGSLVQTVVSFKLPESGEGEQASERALAPVTRLPAKPVKSVPRAEAVNADKPMRSAKKVAGSDEEWDEFQA